jgi:(E)-4-hydroxy-3-methylbut-2-enyl-diphosphate synthase
MGIKRRPARVVKIGDRYIGGNHPVAIQSMVKVKTSDVRRAAAQIKLLTQAGCEIVRVAVKDDADARAIKAIKKHIRIPLVADIHFHWRLALQAIESGVDKIRLNPGNIYKKEQVREVARAAKAAHIPIRVGLNSGSLPGTAGRSLKRRSVPETMVEGALAYIKNLEKCGFHDIVVSLKASNIIDTVAAYRKMASACDYPFHLGVTATGLPAQGMIKSSIAVGALLLDGIGDTLRISLTDNPKEEIAAARCILESLSLRSFGHQIISCPTCGRCEVNLVKLVAALEKKLFSKKNVAAAKLPLKIAVMGCTVNGPGEAKEADIGIAFGKEEGLLFKKGIPQRKVSFADCVDELLKEIRGFHG